MIIRSMFEMRLVILESKMVRSCMLAFPNIFMVCGVLICILQRQPSTPLSLYVVVRRRERRRSTPNPRRSPTSTKRDPRLSSNTSALTTLERSQSSRLSARSAQLVRILSQYLHNYHMIMICHLEQVY